MGDFLRLFSLNGAHLVAGVFYGDFTVSKYGNIMGMKSNVTKDNHENGNIAEDIMGKKKHENEEIGISWDMFPQKDSWLVNSLTWFSIRELQLIMHVDNFFARQVGFVSSSKNVIWKMIENTTE
jgi:hypothetical protein